MANMTERNNGAIYRSGRSMIQLLLGENGPCNQEGLTFNLQKSFFNFNNSNVIYFPILILPLQKTGNVFQDIKKRTIWCAELINIIINYL